jgi:hypothetical protein
MLALLYSLFVVGLTSILLHPLALEGTLLCLFSAFLLFDSGWFARITVPMTIVMAGSVLAPPQDSRPVIRMGQVGLTPRET